LGALLFGLLSFEPLVCGDAEALFDRAASSGEEPVVAEEILAGLASTPPRGPRANVRERL
jgi:hypothetical protein